MHYCISRTFITDLEDRDNGFLDCHILSQEIYLNYVVRAYGCLDYKTIQEAFGRMWNNHKTENCNEYFIFDMDAKPAIECEVYTGQKICGKFVIRVYMKGIKTIENTKFHPLWDDLKNGKEKTMEATKTVEELQNELRDLEASKKEVEEQTKFEDMVFHEALEIIKRSSSTLYDIARDDEGKYPKDFYLIFNEHRNISACLEILKYWDVPQED